MLKKFAIKHGLRHSFKYELPISEEVFEEEIYNFIDKVSLIMMLGEWSGKKLLYGTPENNCLVLKKRRGMFEMRQMIPKTTCTYKEINGVLTFEGRINGLRFTYVFFTSMLIGMYVLFLVMTILGKFQDENLSWLASILLILVMGVVHGSIFVVLPFYQAKRSVKLIKDELESIFSNKLSAKNVE